MQCEFSPAILHVTYALEAVDPSKLCEEEQLCGEEEGGRVASHAQVHESEEVAECAWERGKEIVSEEEVVERGEEAYRGRERGEQVVLQTKVGEGGEGAEFGGYGGELVVVDLECCERGEGAHRWGEVGESIGGYAQRVKPRELGYARGKCVEVVCVERKTYKAGEIKELGREGIQSTWEIFKLAK